MKPLFLSCHTALLLTIASAPNAFGAWNLSTSQGEEADLPVLYSGNDLLQGLIPAVLDGDQGWHDVNTDPADQLPAFTDGQGMRATGLTGLLRDFPPVGQPTKRILYSLAAPVEVDEVRVFSGNNGRDGRVFHTYTVRFSSDGGATFSAPIYVQSHTSGTLNNAGHNSWFAAVTRLTSDTGRLASRVNAVRFDFYGVDNTLGEMRDPFNGVNSFTGVDDSYTAPNTSPLILEIDVMGQFSAPSLTAAPVGGGLRLAWVTGLTNAFVIEASATLEPNSWAAVAPHPQVQQLGAQYSAVITNLASPRYYRLISE